MCDGIVLKGRTSMRVKEAGTIGRQCVNVFSAIIANNYCSPETNPINFESYFHLLKLEKLSRSFWLSFLITKHNYIIIHNKNKVYALGLIRCKPEAAKSKFSKATLASASESNGLAFCSFRTFSRANSRKANANANAKVTKRASSAAYLAAIIITVLFVSITQ